MAVVLCEGTQEAHGPLAVLLAKGLGVVLAPAPPLLPRLLAVLAMVLQQCRQLVLADAKVKKKYKKIIIINSIYIAHILSRITPCALFVSLLNV